MRRYWELFVVFLKTSFMADIEYRLNMSIKILTDLVWYVGQLSVFEVIYHHTNSIAGWDIHSTRVFMGVLFIVDVLYSFLFSENLDHFAYKVKGGQLDLLLAKPVNSQFMLSLQRMNTAYLANFLMVMGFLFWSLTQLPDGFTWVNLLWLFLAIPSAITIVYSIRFLFSCLSVIFVNAESVGWMWYSVYRLGTRPDTFYPRWLRYILLSLLPAGFIASVPSQLILGRGETWMYVAVPGLAIAFFFASNAFWRFALTKYASASS